MSLPPYRNEPHTDFGIEKNRDAMGKALEDVEDGLGRRVDLLVAGERIGTDRTITSTDPARPDPWSAPWPRPRRRSWTGPCATPTPTARNARRMLDRAGPQPLHHYPDEDDSLYYEGMGAVAVIPPWNFPCAILTGMTAAPLVDILPEAGLPAEAFVEAAKGLSLGHAAENADVAAIIDEEQHDKILGYIDQAKAGGNTLLLGGEAVEKKGGRFIRPTIFGDVKPDDTIAQEEIFGPVVAVIRARDHEPAASCGRATSA